MNSKDPLPTIALLGAATIGGTLLGAAIGVVWAIVGGLGGLATALLILVYRVRPVVAVPVAISTAIGAYVGGTIIGVLCEPEGCPAFQAFGAFATGLGALVGVGLVVALATRSFDEFREAAAQQSSDEKPPDTGTASD